MEVTYLYLADWELSEKVGNLKKLHKESEDLQNLIDNLSDEITSAKFEKTNNDQSISDLEKEICKYIQDKALSKEN